MRKKMLSLALALAVCLGLTVPAMAADYTEVVPCKYEEVGNFSEGLAAVSVQEGTYDSSQGMYNYRWGFIDKTGKEVVPCKYIYPSNKNSSFNPEENPQFSEGLARLCILDNESSKKPSNYYGKWGFIDKTGKESISFEYDIAGDFSEGLAMVGVRNGEWTSTELGIVYKFDYGFIDKTGKEVISLQYSDAHSFSEGLAAVAIKSGEKNQYGNDTYKWGFIDKTGQVVISFQPYRAVGNFSEGLAAVRDENDKWGFIDKTGKEVVPCIYSDVRAFSEGLAVVYLNGKCGFIDQTGKEIIPPQYYSANSFSEGLAAVTYENYKDACIDKTGQVVIPMSVRSFSEGLAVRNYGGRYGYVDKMGQEVVPCQYRWAYPVSEGMAAVALGEGASNTWKWGFISIGGTQPTVPTVGNFTDVKTSDYFAEPVVWAVEKNITAGTSSTTFSPNATCTQSQILTFLWRAKGEPKPAGTVSGTEFYASAVQWAKEQGLIDNSFSANDPCTRAMVVTYLWKLAGSPKAGTSDFSDVPANADYAQAVAWAVEQGITSGTSATTFSPTATCSRGQIVSFLYRAFAK